MRHLLSLCNWSTAEIERILDTSRSLKEKLKRQERPPLLAGRTLAMLFEKQSLRTRVSFETAMIQLGGGSLFLGKDVGWGERESIEDFSQVISQYVDAVVCRANSHQKVVDLTQHCLVPVINGLTDLSHPCQALADLFTVREFAGELQGVKLAYVGDANNVARSLAVACGKLGVTFAIAAPDEFSFNPAFTSQLQAMCPDATLLQSTDPKEIVADADFVYTDVWTSMGQESERQRREEAFAPYQVNAELFGCAKPDARFMHCLPARRGEEVTSDVIDSPQSIVIQQAENRMHAQKGLLVELLNPQTS